MSSWTGTKNRRRCRLINKDLADTITVDEQAELERLQEEMLAHRHKFAPLPLEALRAMRDKLESEASDDSAESSDEVSCES